MTTPQRVRDNYKKLHQAFVDNQTALIDFPDKETGSMRYFACIIARTPNPLSVAFFSKKAIQAGEDVLLYPVAEIFDRDLHADLKVPTVKEDKQS